MFKSSLEQERIFEEIKNGTGNLLVNALAGTGKCLGKGTKVMMYNGNFKNVEDIVIGDILMGDDGTPRNVLNTNVGYDDLYEVRLSYSDEFFICNLDHILTCKSIIYPNNNNNSAEETTIDISVKDILNNNVETRIDGTIKNLYLIRSILNYNGSDVSDFYQYGYNFFESDENKYDDLLTTTDNRLLILSGIIDRYMYPLRNLILLDDKYNSDDKNIELLAKLCRGLGIRFRLFEGKYMINTNISHKFTLKNEIFELYYFPEKKRIFNKPPIERFFIRKLEDKDNYYGFTLDGNGRFIINDYIITHNTTTIVKSLEYIPDDKRILMLAFNKHIANELKQRLPKRDNIWISTTHALGWGSIRKKHKNAEIDDNKAYRIINSKIPRWNMGDIDNVDQYIMIIKKFVDLCRLTLTLDRRFVRNLAKTHGYDITDEDVRRILSVISDMYNDRKTFDFIDMVYLPAIDNKLWLFPNDYVFVDECISGENNILTSKGTLRLKDLYTDFTVNKEKWDEDSPKALSYNIETDTHEYKNITNVMHKGVKSVSEIQLHRFKVYCTENHLFYTSEGWREAKDLRVGDLIKANQNHIFTIMLPTEDQSDLLTVMYLNDYVKAPQPNTSKFRFYINTTNKGYYNLVSSLLEIRYKSKINIHYDEYMTKLYQYNDKITDKDYIISNITDKRLALLLMRRFRIIDNRVGFGMRAKSYEEILYFKTLFEGSTNLKYLIKRNLKVYYLFPVDQESFMERVGKYMTNDYKDIFPENFRKYIKGYEWVKPINPEYYVIVKDIKHNFKKEDVYDLTVEDNHNYFVTALFNVPKYKHKTNSDKDVGILSHNCQDYNKAQQFMLNKVIKKDTGRLISVGDHHQCQPIGTKILLSDGTYKYIEDIVVGDKVLSFGDNNITEGIVEGHTYRNFNSKLIVIYSNNKKSSYTDNHRCMVRLKNNNEITEIKASDIIKDQMEMIHYIDNKIEYHDIDNIEYIDYSNKVYSLKISDYETYFADDMLTHNSIYSFMGSDSNSFNWFRERENTKELPLTTSYRCSKNVIRFAQNIVPGINHKFDAVDGTVRNGSVLNEAVSGDFVLSRKNKELVFLLFDLLRIGKNASIRGNDTGKTIASTVKEYKNIKELEGGLDNILLEKRNQLRNLGVLDVLSDPRYVVVEDNVEIIRFLMNNSNSIEDIIKKISFIFTDNPDGIILSTVHKSKGLEADNVFIIKPDKLKLPTKNQEQWKQEENLEYIAYTRAKINLILDTEWTDEETE